MAVVSGNQRYPLDRTYNRAVHPERRTRRMAQEVHRVEPPGPTPGPAVGGWLYRALLPPHIRWQQTLPAKPHPRCALAQMGNSSVPLTGSPPTMQVTVKLQAYLTVEGSRPEVGL